MRGPSNQVMEAIEKGIHLFTAVESEEQEAVDELWECFEELREANGDVGPAFH